VVRPGGRISPQDRDRRPHLPFEDPLSRFICPRIRLDIQYDCSGEYHRPSSSSPRNLRQRLKPVHHQGRVGDRRREINKLSWTVHRRIEDSSRRAVCACSARRACARSRRGCRNSCANSAGCPAGSVVLRQVLEEFHVRRHPERDARIVRPFDDRPGMSWSKNGQWRLARLHLEPVGDFAASGFPDPCRAQIWPSTSSRCRMRQGWPM
jgi:hypothetical protein